MPADTPIEDTDGHGYFKEGYKRNLTLIIGGSPIQQTITYRKVPNVSSTIYQMNSWFNSATMESNVHWDPTVEGDLIQGFIDIHNAHQYQWGNVYAYGEVKDVIVDQMLRPEYGTFNTEAGLMINLDRFDLDQKKYINYETHYITYEDLNYDGGDTFTINFSDLGIISTVDTEVRIMVQFFINHKQTIPYKDANDERTNNATIQYTQADGTLITGEEPAKWYPTDNENILVAEPANRSTSVLINKNWVHYDTQAAPTDIEFVLYADGVKTKSK